MQFFLFCRHSNVNIAGSQIPNSAAGLSDIRQDLHPHCQVFHSTCVTESPPECPLFELPSSSPSFTSGSSLISSPHTPLAGAPLAVHLPQNQIACPPTSISRSRLAQNGAFTIPVRQHSRLAQVFADDSSAAQGQPASGTHCSSRPSAEQSSNLKQVANSVPGSRLRQVPQSNGAKPAAKAPARLHTQAEQISLKQLIKSGNRLPLVYGQARASLPKATLKLSDQQSSTKNVS